MRNLFLMTLAALTLLCACKQETTVVFNEAESTLIINNPPKTGDWVIWYNAISSLPKVTEDSDATVEFVSGSLYRIVPPKSYGNEIVVRFNTIKFERECLAPEGFTLDMGGVRTALPVEYNFIPAEFIQSFEYTPVELSATDMIPALKSVKPLEGTTKVGLLNFDFEDGHPAGWYKIVIDGDVNVTVCDPDGKFYAETTIERIKENAGSDTLPNMVIEDWPDLPFRGLMLDVSRNFTTKDNVLKLIDMLARYKVNYLHLHLGDDEGWRLEIDGLPELTSYAAFRCPPVLNEDGSFEEVDGLHSSYSGSVSTDDAAAPGNGYYSIVDYQEIIKYAWEKHIRVIPEFDSPGHSRAAIKAMEYRYKTTGDASCLLSEEGDKSEYMSVQSYNDNAVNVALESTYTFFEKVFDSVIATYDDAGVPLHSIHIGGDEVASGAWLGSPACKALMESKGWSDANMLKAYFVNRLCDIAAERDVKIDGWQETPQRLDDETFAKLQANIGYTNVWSTSGRQEELPYKMANEGIPTVLSNAPNTYMDFAYNDSHKERGLDWAGYVDERRSFSLLPFNIYYSVRWDDQRNIKDISNASAGKTVLQRPENIIGVQGQLWSETIRSFDHVTYYIFPKGLGVFERGWNAHPVWEFTTVSDDPAFVADFNRFYSIIADREFKYYDSIGVKYHRNDCQY